MELVRAQEGRRILDRLYGYSLSPVLWKKVRTKLSAGRVQSVAVRLVVEKEEERQAFRVARYCDVEATLAGRDLEFGARLTTVDGKRVAGGKDFDPATGPLKSGEGAPAAGLRRRRPAWPTAREGDRALARQRGRAQGDDTAAGAAVHHLHAAAGRQQQARR